jgi:hypothetical protein
MQNACGRYVHSEACGKCTRKMLVNYCSWSRKKCRTDMQHHFASHSIKSPSSDTHKLPEWTWDAHQCSSQLNTWHCPWFCIIWSINRKQTAWISFGSEATAYPATTRQQTFLFETMLQTKKVRRQLTKRGSGAASHGTEFPRIRGGRKNDQPTPWQKDGHQCVPACCFASEPITVSQPHWPIKHEL